MLMKFRITNVDMDGFVGREHHPQRSDVGLVVTAIALQVWNLDPEEAEVSPEMLALRPDLLNDHDAFFTYFTCVTEDGRVLDMVDFELELMSFV